MGRRAGKRREISQAKPLEGNGIRLLRRGAVAMTALIPLAVYPGLERPFSTPKLYLLAWFVVIAGACLPIVDRSARPHLPKWFASSLVAWISALVLSALFGEFVSWEALWVSILCISWFLLLLAIRPDPTLIGTGLVSSCAVLAFIAILQYLGLDPFRFFGWTEPAYGSPRMRVIGTVGNPNFVAAVLVAVLPITVSTARLVKRKSFLSVPITLEVAALFAAGSRAAFPALVAVFLWLILTGNVTRARLPAVVALILLALIPFMPSRPLATTMEGRLYIWRVVSGHLLERPLLGYGPGGFEPKYVEWETEYWRGGHGASPEREFASLQAHAHNDYLETLIDSGLFGLAGFFSVLAAFLVFVWRRRGTPGGELAISAAGGVIALAAVALVDFPMRRPTEFFVFWTLLAMAFLSVDKSGYAPGLDTIAV